MRTEKLLTELDNLVSSSNTIPLTTKRVIEEEDLFQIIEALRETLPMEMEESRKIVEEKEKILEEARRQGESIIEQGKSYIAALTEESEQVKAAHERAAEIIRLSTQSSEELKASSITYAADVFRYVEANLEKALEGLRQNRESLKQTNN